MTIALDGGFASASEESARIFRAALNAMARPGQIETVSGIAPPSPMSAAAGALLLTLADHETPVFLAGAYNCAGLREWLAFHTGVSFASRAEAAFAIGTWSDLAPIDSYRIGTSEYPDRAVTLIVEMEQVVASGTLLQGPGIESHMAVNLPDDSILDFNAARFPLGIDMFLVAGDRMAAVPRSTHRMDREG